MARQTAKTVAKHREVQRQVDRKDKKPSADTPGATQAHGNIRSPRFLGSISQSPVTSASLTLSRCMTRPSTKAPKSWRGKSR